MFRLFYQPGNQDDCHSQRSQITDDEEDDNQQASHGQQNVGGEEIEEIVKRESIDLQWRVIHKAQRCEKADKKCCGTGNHRCLFAAQVQFLREIRK